MKLKSFITLHTIKYYDKRGFKKITIPVPEDSADDARLTIRDIGAENSTAGVVGGITGLAQIRGFRGETKELSQMEKRVLCDLEYINNWSIGFDLSIMVRTLFALFSKNA